MTQRITEWQPTSLRDVPGLLFFGSAVGVVVLIARRGERTPWPTLAWLGAFFVIGAYAIRGVAWWPLGAVAAIAGVLVTSRVSDPSRPLALGTPLMRRLNVVVAGAIVVVGVTLLPLWRPVDPELRAPAGVVGMAPPGITATLRELGRPGDHVLNPQPWGSWFEFELPAPPRRRRFTDRDLPGELSGMPTRRSWPGSMAGRPNSTSGMSRSSSSASKDQEFFDRLTSAGWQSVHADADGWVVVRADR